MITHALEDKPLPIYGDGLYVRSWLYVQDLCEAIGRIFDRGIPGEIYNISGQEKKNLDVAHAVLDLLKKPKSLIAHVKDRPGHDRRYAIDSDKIRKELGWNPTHPFDAGLRHDRRLVSGGAGLVEADQIGRVSSTEEALKRISPLL